MLQNPQLHYLDNAATTIVAPEVADVIDKAMREHWANPSSLYGPGGVQGFFTARARAVQAGRVCPVLPHGLVYDVRHLRRYDGGGRVVQIM